LGALICLLSSCSDENNNATAEVQIKLPAFVANQILIKFKPTKSGERTSNTILSLIGGSTVEVINTKSMQSLSAKTRPRRKTFISKFRFGYNGSY
jgi:hypothetical protein